MLETLLAVPVGSSRLVVAVAVAVAETAEGTVAVACRAKRAGGGPALACGARALSACRSGEASAPREDALRRSVVAKKESIFRRA